MLDGSGATPVIRDFIIGEDLAHLHGDLMTMESDGFMDLADNGDTEMLGVLQESKTAAQITAESTTIKVAIVTRNQVWRCSMDAATTALIIGATKDVDLVDHNTIDADNAGSGGLVLVDNSELDEDGNVMAYVVFKDTCFGNG